MSNYKQKGLTDFWNQFIGASLRTVQDIKRLIAERSGFPEEELFVELGTDWVAVRDNYTLPPKINVYSSRIRESFNFSLNDPDGFTTMVEAMKKADCLYKDEKQSLATEIEEMEKELKIKKRKLDQQ